MKKIFATILALAMLLSFASCAAEDKAPATTPEAGTTVETKGEPASDKTVGQIAGNCGFEDTNYFSRCYKKHYGASPNKHRQKK